MNTLIPRRALLTSRRWWLVLGITCAVILVATTLSYTVALTALEVSPILLVPGVGAALLARFGRSLWPAVVIGDAIGQAILHDRPLWVMALTALIHVVACVAAATWLQHTGCWLRTLASSATFAGIAVIVSIVSASLTALALAARDAIPADDSIAVVIAWLAMGYLAGFIVGGGFVLAWSDPERPLDAAFRQPMAMASLVVVAVVAGFGLIGEVGGLVPLALLGAIAIAGRAGMRWGTAAILAITLMAIEGSHRGAHAPFGGQDPAEVAANLMLAISLFGAAVILLAAYRESGETRHGSPRAVPVIFGALMLVAGITSLAANEVDLHHPMPYVISGILSLGAAIGLGVLRISRTPDMPSTRRGITLAACAGVLYVVNLGVYLQAVPLIGSGPATGLSMTAPLWVVLIGVVIYRTRPPLAVVAGIALIVGGAIAIAIATRSVGGVSGIVLALASAAVFAASVIITKQALAHASVIDVALVSSVAAAVVALVVGIITEGVAAFDLTAAEYGALAVAALGAQLVPTLGRSWALARISPDVVGAEGVLAPVTTTLLSFWFLDAVTTGGDIAGLVLITIGAVVAAVSRPRTTAQAGTARGAGLRAGTGDRLRRLRTAMRH